RLIKSKQNKNVTNLFLRVTRIIITQLRINYLGGNKTKYKYQNKCKEKTQKTYTQKYFLLKIFTNRIRFINKYTTKHAIHYQKYQFVYSQCFQYGWYITHQRLKRVTYLEYYQFRTKKGKLCCCQYSQIYN
ncbi:hypothetical protein ABPG73_003577, partial [Tetrahymena malaccensis]